MGAKSVDSGSLRRVANPRCAAPLGRKARLTLTARLQAGSVGLLIACTRERGAVSQWVAMAADGVYLLFYP